MATFRLSRISSRHLALLGAVVLLVSACGGASASASPKSVAPSSTPPPALPAGAYTSAVFKPPVTVTLPAGWLIAADDADYFGVRPAAADALGVHIFRSPHAASQDLQCPTAAAKDVGTAAKDLVGWIRARPGLKVGASVPVALGGFAGLHVDVAIADGWAASCPFANGAPTVPLFVGPSDASFRWVIAGSERLSLDILDVPGKGTLVVDVDAFDGSLMDGFLPVAGPIVASLAFGLP